MSDFGICPTREPPLQSPAMLRKSIFTAALLAGAAVSQAAAPQAWEFRGGMWQQSVVPSTQPVQDETLDRVEQLLQRGDAKGARQLDLVWLNQHKTSPVRDRAVYLLGEAYYQLGNRILAFYLCDEVMDEYPDSDLYYSALQRQYDIADAFLSGYKRRFFGLAILPAEDEAIEMLFRIQQRSPGSPLAEKSLLRSADYYFATSQFDLAGDTYGAYARSYPRSPVLARVKLRQAYATLAQFRGTRFDPTPLIDSRTQLSDLIQAYPDLGTSENLPSVIDRIDATFARKLFVTADFYRRTHEPTAAVYTYRFLISTYPASPEAVRAKVALMRFAPKYLNTREPAPASGYAPTTLPVAPLTEPIK
jgi:outer membrane assembly lipoprotein YfiO